MIIGVPKEIRPEENRVSVTPAGVEILKERGHTVLIEKDAGAGSGFDNALYARAGADVVEYWKDVWERSEMILRVKAPLPSEYELLREGQIYFSFLQEKYTRPVRSSF